MGQHIEKVLITGGAGFIGSHTANLLASKGYLVTVLDTLEPQVHRETQKPPSYLNSKDMVFIKGSVNDRKLLKKTLVDQDAVIHLAAVVGVGQSMYQVQKYINVNTCGTATLLDILVNEDHDVKKVIVASSMSIYGEGKYRCDRCQKEEYPNLRSEEQLARRSWDYRCPFCSSNLKASPTDEAKPLMPTSIYALSKRHQEETSLLIGRTFGIPTVALRYFNIYGSHQALSNPYTGVVAIFTNRILNNKAPYIFEDGNQTRDFIHVSDVVKANLLALVHDTADYETVNIGTGTPTTIKSIAEILIKLFSSKVKPYISQKYRKGDIRHCFADVTKAKTKLDFQPTIRLEEGLKEFSKWVALQRKTASDTLSKALKELRKRELTV